MTRRGLLGLLGAGVTTALLSGCGRKGKPEVPEGALYPHVYPHTPYPGQKPPPRSGTGEAPRAPSAETDPSQ